VGVEISAENSGDERVNVMGSEDGEVLAVVCDVMVEVD
jgi:hypothetical protein